MEENIYVAFQGEHGAYSEEAAFSYFGESIITIPCKNMSDVFEAMKNNEVNFAVVPVENSIEGTVGVTYNLLLEHNLMACGEVFQRIRHCLIALPKETLKTIKRVYSHPQALGQCREFIEMNRYEAIPVYDTAGSVKLIKAKNLRESAGIASEMAARIYKMNILQSGIETNQNNYTRFLVLAKTDAIQTGNDKTSIIFSTKHEPGALHNALKAFAKRDINLTKLESRPIIGKLWEYNFILDFEGHRTNKNVLAALIDLQKNSEFIKIIGSYPKSSVSD
jgi:chorismate mutase / prephenate dehydratase